MARRKKIVQNVQISGVADRGKSIGRNPEGKVFFVDGAVPGDNVDVLVLRKKKGVPFGIVNKMNELSSARVKPKCEHFGICGGCKWQNLDYEAQLKHKNQTAIDAIKRIAKVDDWEIESILGSDPIYEYRNKLEYSFSNKRWLTQEEINSDKQFDDPALGFHRPGTFDKIVDIQTCHLQENLSNEIRNFVRAYAIENGLAFFDIKKQEGLLRNMIVRNSTLGEWMLLFSFYHESEEIESLLKAVETSFPQLKEILYVINSKKNDTIFDREVKTFKGEGHIFEMLDDIKYKIGPKSFFQTNPKQAKALYDIVVEYCGLSGDENVYDLYTGLGSIALYVAGKCRNVVGIEEVEDAIVDANFNKQLNGIKNAEFYAGRVRDIMQEGFLNKHGKPDLIITDPPRVGMHADVVESLLKIESPKIVYVSCNPSTQARDILMLSEKYELIKTRAVDMFPHTHHVENIALLKLKENE